MTPEKATELKVKIGQLKGLMTAYSTDGRRPVESALRTSVAVEDQSSLLGRLNYMPVFASAATACGTVWMPH